MNKLYRDTVTLYHADAAAQTVVRTVLRGVCWQQGRRELPDAGGTRRGAALLVVIPETTARYGADYTIIPNVPCGYAETIFFPINKVPSSFHHTVSA